MSGRRQVAKWEEFQAEQAADSLATTRLLVELFVVVTGSSSVALASSVWTIAQIL